MLVIQFALLAVLAAPIATQAGVTTCGWSTEPIGPTQCPERAAALAVGSNGRQHLVYFGDNGTGGCGPMFYLTRVPTGPWSAPIFVANNASHRTSIGLGLSGEPYVSYFNGADESERVMVMVNGVFVEFGTPLKSGSAWKGGAGGEVAVDSNGKVYLAYFHGDTDAAHLAEWSNGTWSVTVVQDATGPVGVGKGMNLVITQDDRPVMAYLDQDNQWTSIAERLLDGTTWVFAQTATGDPADLGAFHNGDLVLFHRADNSGLPAKVDFKKAGSWTNDPAFPGAQYHGGSVVTDAAGTTHILAQGNGGLLDYLRLDQGGTWQTVSITTTAAGGFAGDIDLSPDGAVLAVYTRLLDQKLVMFSDACPGASTFCTSKPSSIPGCVPFLTGPSPTLSLGAGSGSFDLTAAPVPGGPGKPAILIYTTTGLLGSPLTTPFGDLCLSQFKRLGTFTSVPGGTPDLCDGSYDWDFGNIVALTPGIQVGDTLHLQAWYRDPTNPGSANFTNGVGPIAVDP